jgi:hypothetical protein
MEEFSPHIRHQNLSWSINQIKLLINQAKKDRSATFIIYAALECRNIIERIEFELIVIAANNSLDLTWQDLITEYKGIQKVNSKYKALKFKYQTFTEAFSKVINSEFTIKAFDFKRAEALQDKLSQYIHLYTRETEQLSYGSEFIQAGLKLIEGTIPFLENMFTLHNDNYAFGILDFSSLKNGFEVEFQNWLKSVDENVDALTERLRIIATKIKDEQ